MTLKPHIFRLFVVLSISLSFWACDDEFHPGNSSTYPINGTYSIHYNQDTSADYQKIFLYNTAFSNDSLWLEDPNAPYGGHKTKVLGNLSMLTFASTSTESHTKYIRTNGIITDTVVYQQTISIQGEIFTEPEPDSIAITTSFQFDTHYTDTSFTITGHRTTGFENQEEE